MKTKELDDVLGFFNVQYLFEQMRVYMKYDCNVIKRCFSDFYIDKFTDEALHDLNLCSDPW